MRRIYYVIAVAALAATFYLGYRTGSPAVDNAEVKVLDKKNDSINNRLKLAYFINSRLMDTVSQQRRYIEGINKQVLQQEQVIATIHVEFDKLGERFQRASLKQLDSLRWRWYPDSVTVARAALTRVRK